MKTSYFVALVGVLLLIPSTGVAQSSTLQRSFIGVRLEEASGHVRVAAVLPGSPADRGGLGVGDLIIEVASHPVSTPDEVISQITSGRIGDSMGLTVRRSGLQTVVNVVLGSTPASGAVMQSYVGRPAPAIDLQRIDGSGRVDLAGLRGRVVVVYFWSLWCGACRMATPVLERLYRSLEPRGLTVLGIADDPLDRLRAATSTSAMRFPIIHDIGSKVGVSYWVDAVPSIFVVDRAGDVAYAMEGWASSADSAIEQEILRLLGQASP